MMGFESLADPPSEFAIVTTDPVVTIASLSGKRHNRHSGRRLRFSALRTVRRDADESPRRAAEYD